MTPNHRRQEKARWWQTMLEFYHRDVPEGLGRYDRWAAWGIRHGADPFTRYRFACFSGIYSRQCLVTALIAGARDPQEHYLVRGMCLESLAHQAQGDPPISYRDKKVCRVVLECLNDPHPNVRFWACFAAGELRLRAAKSALRSLKGDQGLGDMGWTVDYEAGEALKAIRGEPAWEEHPPQAECPYPKLW